MNILLIEPDKILADNFAKVFKMAGLNSKVMFDAQLAIEHIDDDKPDVIVLELQLAPISGVSFLYELRSYQDLAKIPIIIYSSLPPENFDLDDQLWANLGVVKYFYKSKISINKLTSYIQENLA
jgi:DNA-binding response OmpR family regulator